MMFADRGCVKAAVWHFQCQGSPWPGDHVWEGWEGAHLRDDGLNMFVHLAARRPGIHQCMCTHILIDAHAHINACLSSVPAYQCQLIKTSSSMLAHQCRFVLWRAGHSPHAHTEARTHTRRLARRLASKQARRPAHGHTGVDSAGPSVPAD